MTVVRFQVLLEDEAPAAEVATELEQRLGRLDDVEEVQVEPSQLQSVEAIVVTVAGAVALTRGGRDIVIALRETIDELTRLVESGRRFVRALLVEIDGQQVDVREVGDEELERLAGRS